jgi:hypothetical protein
LPPSYFKANSCTKNAKSRSVIGYEPIYLIDVARMRCIKVVCKRLLTGVLTQRMAPLRDIPERVGYDLVLLGLETLPGQAFTLWRSVDGGGFRLYEDCTSHRQRTICRISSSTSSTVIETTRTSPPSCLDCADSEASASAGTHATRQTALAHNLDAQVTEADATVFLGSNRFAALRAARAAD